MHAIRRFCVSRFERSRMPFSASFSPLLAFLVFLLLFFSFIFLSFLPLPAHADDNSSYAKENTERGHSVIIFTSGLRWDLFDPHITPALASLARDGVVANLVPLSQPGGSCPIDAWMSINTGQKFSARSLSPSGCPQPWIESNTRLSRWDSYVDAALPAARSSVGDFGHSIRAAGLSLFTIGTGAAFATTTSEGMARSYNQNAPNSSLELATQSAFAASSHDVTVVDADIESYIPFSQIRDAVEGGAEGITLPERDHSFDFSTILSQGVRSEIDPEDAQALGTLSQSLGLVTKFGQLNALRVEAIVRNLPAGTRVFLASLSGVHGSQSLQTVMSGVVPDECTDVLSLGAGAVYSAPSVHRIALMQVSDLSATLQSWLQIEPSSTNALAARAAVSQYMSSDRGQQLSQQAIHSSAMRLVRGSFFRWMIYSAIIYFLLSLLILHPRVYGILRSYRPARLLTILWSFSGITLANFPGASVVVNGFSWWNSSDPSYALIAQSWACAAGFTCIALCMRFFLRSHPWAPYIPMILSGAWVSIFLAWDAATGSHLMADSPLGFNILAAARFYGLGNEAYAVMISGFFLSFAAVAVCAPHPKRAAGILAAIGLLFAAIDAAPRMGADFGGILSFLPALLVLLFSVARVQISWKKAAVAFAVTLLAAIGVAFADYLQPAAQRTHLGIFIARVIDGQLWEVLSGKLATNLRLLTSSLHRWTVIVGIIVIVCAVIPTLRGTASQTKKRQTVEVIPQESSACGKRSRATTRLTRWHFSRLHIPLPARLTFAGVKIARMCAPRSLACSPRYYPLSHFRGVFRAFLLCIVLAWLLNDSGIVLPGMALVVALPLILTSMEYCVRDSLPGTKMASSNSDLSQE